MCAVPLLSIRAYHLDTGSAAMRVFLAHDRAKMHMSWICVFGIGHAKPGGLHCLRLRGHGLAGNVDTGGLTQFGSGWVLVGASPEGGRHTTCISAQTHQFLMTGDLLAVLAMSDIFLVFENLCSRKTMACSVANGCCTWRPHYSRS